MFKSVFTKSTEPWVYTTHVDAPHEHVHFSLPAAARATSVAVQPTFDTLMLMAPGDDDAAEASRSIPYITPFPLDDEKLGLVSALLDEVNRVQPTGVGLESGTVLALKSEWAAAAAGRVRRSRARVQSDPGSMTETLTQLDTLRRTNIETHRSLAGTVERIRGQANNIRAQLRESRRTPSLADIVALNNAALGR